ncbi:MAG: sugar ABC transporter substrate-binding protein [Chloroflexota bacterium]
MRLNDVRSRRSFLRFAAATAATGASLLAACSQPAAPAQEAKPASQAAPAAPPAASKPADAKPAADAKPSGDFDWKRFNGKTLQIALNKHPYTESLMPQIPQFEQLTGIKVTNLTLPENEYFQKILVDLSTGAGEYDVFMTGPTRHWAYSRAGWIQPLDDFLDDPKLTAPDYQKDDLFPALVGANRWDQTINGGVGKGKLYAIPVHVETYVQVYRKDLYDQAGIKPANTVEEWRANNKKITQGDVKGVIARGFKGGGIAGTGFASMFRSYGGRVFDESGQCQINTPEGIHVATEYCASMKESGPPGWTSVTWYEGQEGFAAGQYGGYMDCDFFSALYENKEKSKVAGKIALAPVPRAPGKDPVSGLFTWALGMSSKARDKNAAWYFIMWATSKAQMQKATIEGRNYNPTRKSVFDHADVQATLKSWGNGTYLPVVLDNLNKNASMNWPGQPEGPFVGTRWDQALQEIWGGADAKQALTSAKEDIDGQMKKAGLLK